ncbi:entericidin A/B family lipoprotein [Neptunicella marina]|uniref:Entericidin A/B family lipoprotein n=1 Tax=Neptunicella marina TaxID=2125989 RepID=A0A8J6M3T9_9ALTE|nr:entericidin A/B family lipoprotein [Neptunicella marina]MBC3767437.1 entericidin A/B family lipoprotein [Neptunicella marina]
MKNSKMMSVISTSVMLLTLLLGLAGCATIEGAGKDIESAGEAVQDAAD